MTLYQPLKPGDTITKECVTFINGCSVAPFPHIIGTQFETGCPTYFLPITVPDTFLPASPEVPKEADPYAFLKQAHAAGKVIQLHSVQKHELPFHKLSEEEWYDCSPQWAPNRYYRIKPGQDDVQEITPAPEKTEEWVPLDAEDCPPGCVFWHPDAMESSSWKNPLTISEAGVSFVSALGDRVTIAVVKYEEMKAWQISRNFGKTWDPCLKRATIPSLSKRTPDEYPSESQEVSL